MTFSFPFFLCVDNFAIRLLQTRNRRKWLNSDYFKPFHAVKGQNGFDWEEFPCASKSSRDSIKSRVERRDNPRSKQKHFLVVANRGWDLEVLPLGSWAFLCISLPTLESLVILGLLIVYRQSRALVLLLSRRSVWLVKIRHTMAI